MMKSECSSNDCKCGCHRPCWCKLAFAFALANAIGLFVLGLLGTFCGYGLMMISTIASIYPGYGPTVGGSFIGAFWGFLDILVFVLIAGGIYHVLKKCCNKCCASQCSTTACDTKKVEK